MADETVCDDCGLWYRDEFFACPYCKYELHAKRAKGEAWKYLRYS